MKSALLSAGHLLLALSLVTAGLPVHAMMGGVVSDFHGFQLEGEPGVEHSESASTQSCPYHTAPDAAGEESAPEFAEDCCGPDCRCSCAGLTLIVTPVFEGPPGPAPESDHPSNQQNLPSLASSPLPRPPQA